MSRYYVALGGKDFGFDFVQEGGQTLLRLVLDGDHDTSQRVDFAPVHANPQTGEGLYSLILDGKSYQMYVTLERPEHIVEISRYRFKARVLTEREWRLEQIAPKQAAHTGKTAVTAPMPGMVKSVLVEAGTEVFVGTRLLVLEAMKMENDIVSTRDGRVTEVHVRAGIIVDGGKPLVTIE